MSYLYIKQRDVKTFKAFLSGREVQLNVSVSPKTNMFDKGQEVEVFYGDDYSDSYPAQIVNQKLAAPVENAERAVITLSLQKR